MNSNDVNTYHFEIQDDDLVRKRGLPIENESDFDKYLREGSQYRRKCGICRRTPCSGHFGYIELYGWVVDDPNKTGVFGPQSQIRLGIGCCGIHARKLNTCKALNFTRKDEALNFTHKEIETLKGHSNFQKRQEIAFELLTTNKEHNARGKRTTCVHCGEPVLFFLSIDIDHASIVCGYKEEVKYEENGDSLKKVTSIKEVSVEMSTMKRFLSQEQLRLIFGTLPAVYLRKVIPVIPAPFIDKTGIVTNAFGQHKSQSHSERTNINSDQIAFQAIDQRLAEKYRDIVSIVNDKRMDFTTVQRKIQYIWTNIQGLIKEDINGKYGYFNRLVMGRNLNVARLMATVLTERPIHQVILPRGSVKTTEQVIPANISILNHLFNIGSVVSVSRDSMNTPFRDIKSLCIGDVVVHDMPPLVFMHRFPTVSLTSFASVQLKMDRLIRTLFFLKQTEVATLEKILTLEHSSIHTALLTDCVWNGIRTGYVEIEAFTDGLKRYGIYNGNIEYEINDTKRILQQALRRIINGMAKTLSSVKFSNVISDLFHADYDGDMTEYLRASVRGWYTRIARFIMGVDGKPLVKPTDATSMILHHICSEVKNQIVMTKSNALMLLKKLKEFLEFDDPLYNVSEVWNRFELNVLETLDFKGNVSFRELVKAALVSIPGITVPHILKHGEFLTDNWTSKKMLSDGLYIECAYQQNPDLTLDVINLLVALVHFYPRHLSVCLDDLVPNAIRTGNPDDSFLFSEYKQIQQKECAEKICFLQKNFDEVVRVVKEMQESFDSVVGPLSLAVEPGTDSSIWTREFDEVCEATFSESLQMNDLTDYLDKTSDDYEDKLREVNKILLIPGAMQLEIMWNQRVLKQLEDTIMAILDPIYEKASAGVIPAYWVLRNKVQTHEDFIDSVKRMSVGHRDEIEKLIDNFVQRYVYTDKKEEWKNILMSRIYNLVGNLFRPRSSLNYHHAYFVARELHVPLEDREELKKSMRPTNSPCVETEYTKQLTLLPPIQRWPILKRFSNFVQTVSGKTKYDVDSKFRTHIQETLQNGSSEARKRIHLTETDLKNFDVEMLLRRPRNCERSLCEVNNECGNKPIQWGKSTVAAGVFEHNGRYARVFLDGRQYPWDSKKGNINSWNLNYMQQSYAEGMPYHVAEVNAVNAQLNALVKRKELPETGMCVKQGAGFLQQIMTGVNGASYLHVSYGSKQQPHNGVLIDPISLCFGCEPRKLTHCNKDVLCSILGLKNLPIRIQRERYRQCIDNFQLFLDVMLGNDITLPVNLIYIEHHFGSLEKADPDPDDTSELYIDFIRHVDSVIEDMNVFMSRNILWETILQLFFAPELVFGQKRWTQNTAMEALSVVKRRFLNALIPENSPVGALTAIEFGRTPIQSGIDVAKKGRVEGSSSSSDETESAMIVFSIKNTFSPTNPPDVRVVEFSLRPEVHADPERVKAFIDRYETTYLKDIIKDIFPVENIMKHGLIAEESKPLIRGFLQAITPSFIDIDDMISGPAVLVICNKYELQRYTNITNVIVRTNRVFMSSEMRKDNKKCLFLRAIPIFNEEEPAMFAIVTYRRTDKQLSNAESNADGSMKTDKSSKLNLKYIDLHLRIVVLKGSFNYLFVRKSVAKKIDNQYALFVQSNGTTASIQNHTERCMEFLIDDDDVFTPSIRLNDVLMISHHRGILASNDFMHSQICLQLQKTKTTYLARTIANMFTCTGRVGGVRVGHLNNRSELYDVIARAANEGSIDRFEEAAILGQEGNFSTPHSCLPLGRSMLPPSSTTYRILPQNRSTNRALQVEFRDQANNMGLDTQEVEYDLDIAHVENVQDRSIGRQVPSHLIQQMKRSFVEASIANKMEDMFYPYKQMKIRKSIANRHGFCQDESDSDSDSDEDEDEDVRNNANLSSGFPFRLCEHDDEDDDCDQSMEDFYNCCEEQEEISNNQLSFHSDDKLNRRSIPVKQMLRNVGINQPGFTRVQLDWMQTQLHDSQVNPRAVPFQTMVNGMGLGDYF